MKNLRSFPVVSLYVLNKLFKTNSYKIFVTFDSPYLAECP